MKILYGVQATGNGHISRSREVIRHLKNLGHAVRVILSGRDPAMLWEMETFEPYDTLRGLTFVSRRGKVCIIRTALQLNLFQFYRDIFSYDATGYDLIVTDFEPATARIARRNNIPSIGVGHQYAFLHDIPVQKADPFSMWVVKNFAPADYPVGLHWHHFNQPILPPIIPGYLKNSPKITENKILVYLPFEALEDIESLLKPLKSHQFFIYCNSDSARDEANLHLRPFSRTGFLDDLKDCCGVICNAGFELISEALYLGKKFMVKPLVGQMEQASNAHAIALLKLGMVMKELSQQSVEQFLAAPSAAPIEYPDVALLVAQWIESGSWEDIQSLARSAWRDIKFS